MIDIAVVPVAGLGTRLLPATKSQPKEMLPVGRKPVVQYVVEELARVGVRRVLFVTGPGKASIENHFDLNGELIQSLREKPPRMPVRARFRPWLLHRRQGHPVRRGVTDAGYRLPLINHRLLNKKTWAA